MLEKIQRFLAYLHTERQYSPHTRQAYERDLAGFIGFMQVQEIASWQSVSSHQVRAYIAEMHRKGASPKSIQRRLSSLRSFYRFLMREGEAQHDPVQGVNAPKAAKRLPAVLDTDQVSRLLEGPDDGPLTIRDIAMMECLYSSGMRLAELVSLDMKDVDVYENLVRLTGKGNKVRVVPLGSKAKSQLQRWLPVRRDWLADLSLECQALFITRRGHRISPRTVQQRLQQWGIKQALSDKVHPHRLRHAFASHLLESSGDIRAIQELLGHANLSTTQIYTHLDFQHLAQVYDEAHPRGKKKKA